MGYADQGISYLFPDTGIQFLTLNSAWQIDMKGRKKAGIHPDIQAPDNEMRQDLAVESYYDDQDDVGKYRELQQKIDRIQLDKALEVLSMQSAPAKKAA